MRTGLRSGASRVAGAGMAALLVLLLPAGTVSVADGAQEQNMALAGKTFHYRYESGFE
jgi:hypothetical protein